MDALKLRLRAKDQLHPLLQELMTGYARFKGSAEWQGRGRIVQWQVCSPALFVMLISMVSTFTRLITLNAMKASDEITEEQSRQASPKLQVSALVELITTPIVAV